MKYLRNSKEIRNKLHEIYSKKGDKWGIVGFVGYNAIDFLPKGVVDLSIICWPKPGGTNPDGIRRLIDKGISVYFCNRLHQKLYWVKNTGLIVSSSNLSENALGEGGLHEFGVFCDDKEFEINDILSKLEYTKVSEEKLDELDVEHTGESRKGTHSGSSDRKTPSFIEAMETKHPKKWKIVTWSEEREDSQVIKKEVKEKFYTTVWDNDNDVEPTKYEIGDFVLQLKTDEDDVIQRANGKWLVVDHIVKRSKSGHIIVQVKKIDNKTPPPFEIDSDFKKHFKNAFNATEWDRILKSNYTVKPGFCKYIKSLYT